jgi:two-component system, OmpR family, response regulator CpxR
MDINIRDVLENTRKDSNVDRILVIDDDVELCELLSEYLGAEGFIIETVNDSEKGINRALSGEHSFVVLDVMLPVQNGFEVLQRIRTSSTIPVLMLTARGDEVDRIIGLEMGADDYLPKPFNPRELVARLKAIRRRTKDIPSGIGSIIKEGAVVVGDVVLDPGTRVVTQSGQKISMTSAEFSLLRELLVNAGRVVSREDLALKVLGRKISVFDRSVDVHVASLRKKLGHEAHGLERIRTIRSVGYMYSDINGIS